MYIVVYILTIDKQLNLLSESGTSKGSVLLDTKRNANQNRRNNYRYSVWFNHSKIEYRMSEYLAITFILDVYISHSS